MGLNIKEIIPRKELDIDTLKGKVLCVDAFNAIYQFLSTIRQFDGTPLMDSKERITSHLSGIFYRNVSLLSKGIKIVYVFDGEPPQLKSKVHELRSKSREIARQRYETAKKEGDFSSMRSYGSQIIRLDDSMIEESKKLLMAMGIPVIQAPGEGEAECAYLSKSKKEIYATVSQDYDCLLFGAPFLIRNLAVSKKKKTVTGYQEVLPEIISLENVLSELGINQDQLISLGILVGTDYNPKGIPGIGQKKALDIVKQHKTPKEIFESLREKIDSLSDKDSFDWSEIFDLLKNPEVVDEDFEFPPINSEEIIKLLVEEHGFSEERVLKQISKLKEAEKLKNQKSLSDWF